MLIMVLICVSSLTALAQDPGKLESGLSGRIQGGAFFLQSDSQLLVTDSDSINTNLEGPVERYDEFSAIASVYLHYQFESGTAIYAGNPMEIGEGLSLNAGVIQPLGDTSLDVAFTWLPINEVWKNPYRTNAAREKSDADVYGIRLKLLTIEGSRWEAEYDLERIDIDEDEIGGTEDDLKRTGWSHELGLKYTFPFRQGGVIRPEITYTYGDMDGHSNSYHGLDAGILLQQNSQPWIFIGRVSGFYNKYQKTHPIFDKTRQEGGISAFVQAIRLNLFGVERLFASLAAGYVWSDANIDFFDSQTVVGLASVGINF
ncbi:putative protein DUF2860 [Desulfosarcina variabilis str. Montpellier]